jgi:hypothetical protein
MTTLGSYQYQPVSRPHLGLEAAQAGAIRNEANKIIH